MAKSKPKPRVLDRLDAENAERMRPNGLNRPLPETFKRWPVWQKAIVLAALIIVIAAYLVVRTTTR